MEPCPSCRKEIDIDARPCPYCGRPIPFSDELKEMIIKRYIEERRREDEIRQKRIKKEEEEKKMFNEQMKEEILNGKFWLAFSISTNKLNHSQTYTEFLIKKISDEIGMSDEFEKWRKKKDVTGKIFAFIVIILIPLIWIIYKWFNN